MRRERRSSSRGGASRGCPEAALRRLGDDGGGGPAWEPKARSSSSSLSSSFAFEAAPPRRSRSLSRRRVSPRRRARPSAPPRARTGGCRRRGTGRGSRWTRERRRPPRLGGRAGDDPRLPPRDRADGSERAGRRRPGRPSRRRTRSVGPAGVRVELPSCSAPTERRAVRGRFRLERDLVVHRRDAARVRGRRVRARGASARARRRDAPRGSGRPPPTVVRGGSRGRRAAGPREEARALASFARLLLVEPRPCAAAGSAVPRRTRPARAGPRPSGAAARRADAVRDDAEGAGSPSPPVIIAARRQWAEGAFKNR